MLVCQDDNRPRVRADLRFRRNGAHVLHPVSPRRNTTSTTTSRTIYFTGLTPAIRQTPVYFEHSEP